jgi:hypothetical protein
MAMWLSAVPLAASLVLGFYVGTMESLPDSVASLAPGLFADATDAVLDIGTEDTESFLNGDFS